VRRGRRAIASSRRIGCDSLEEALANGDYCNGVVEESCVLSRCPLLHAEDD
jgi:hypothetical protein